VQPLTGLRALDLSTGLAGRLAGGLLAEFGAEVTRVETSVDAAKDILPQYIYADHAKTVRVAADSELATVVRAEMSRSDVCIADGRDALIRHGVEVSDAHVVLLTPPYLADETPWTGGGESAPLLDAYSGFSAFQASYSGRPIAFTYPYLTIVQGTWAATCAAAALLEREQSGLGQAVEVNGVHAANIFCGFLYARPADASEPDRAIGPGGLNPLYTRYQAADGKWVFVGALGPKFARALLAATGSLHLLKDHRVEGRIDALWRPENRPWVFDYFIEYFAAKPAADWIDVLEAADVPCSIVAARERWFASEQVKAIGMVRDVEHPRVGPVRMPAVPIATMRHRAATSITPPLRSGHGPLGQYRVISLGTFVAGPYAAGLLAELGADVIKVEPPEGDPWRMVGFVYNRGTRSLAVDLSEPEGRSVLHDVLRTGNALLNNFRLGVMDRLGLDFAHLADVAQQVVSVGVTAYGEVGTEAPKPGYDTVLQAASGIMSAQGGADEPVVLSLPVNDHTAAVLGALTVVLGLLEQCRFGATHQLSTSLAATSVYLQIGDLVDYEGRPAHTLGSTDFPGPTPYDRIYPTRDGHVRVHHRDLARIVPHHEATPLGADPAERALAWLGGELTERTTEDALTWLAAMGVPAVKARTITDVCRDTSLYDQALLEHRVSTSGIEYSQPGRLATFSRTPQRPHPDAPGLGEHSAELLTELGYTTDRIRDLVRDSVLVTGQPLELEFAPPYR
jgi:crotonobetainyl-CoA:carnitine CoA-transferase CaiB-like acyl-CoA transferase